MPEIGEIRNARQIGIIGSSRYTWQACPDCGKERWVHLNKDIYPCRRCTRVGQKNANWKGGRRREKRGYVIIWVSRDDMCWSMTSGDGYIHEHRLVMARYLGRGLIRGEQVHHKNGVKDDNRIENLELMPNIGSHTRLTVCSRCELRKEIRLLKWQVKEQGQQIRDLTSRLMFKVNKKGGELKCQTKN